MNLLVYLLVIVWHLRFLQDFQTYYCTTQTEWPQDCHFLR